MGEAAAVTKAEVATTAAGSLSQGRSVFHEASCNPWPGLPGWLQPRRTRGARFFVVPRRKQARRRSTIESPKGGSNRMSILWIILIVILVLALLGFFSRGRW